MMRVMVIGAFVLTLAGCVSPEVPESGAGFDSYTDYVGRTAQRNAQRDAQLQGQQAGQQETTIRPPETSAGQQTALAETTPTATTSTPAKTSARPNNVGISDEQDFGAVKSRETIESDRERLARQRAQYKVIPPTALPARPGSVGPSIVEYALSTTNNVGEARYRRSGLFAESRYNRNCGKYASPDLAQLDFLRKGGPQKDRMGVDPDGDGFACSWDPQPFRTAKYRAANN